MDDDGRIKRCGELRLEIHWMDKLVVEVECFGKCVDAVLIGTVLFGKQKLHQHGHVLLIFRKASPEDEFSILQADSKECDSKGLIALIDRLDEVFSDDSGSGDKGMVTSAVKNTSCDVWHQWVGDHHHLSGTLEQLDRSLVGKIQICVDKFDKVTVLFGEMQLKQEDRSYVHASNELHLHVDHGSFNCKHEAGSNIVTISRGHGDEDKDEEPSAGSNRKTKRRRSGKETESTNEPTHKESQTISSSREAQDKRQWHPSSSPTPDHEWHLTKTVSDLPSQPWITHLA
ncbi:hypothetical protein Tco_0563757 [Tanacetum coccineum]